MHQSQLSAEALSGAVALLKGLPRDRHDLRASRQQFRRFADQHPRIEARLIAERRPASNEIDFDVLLTEQDGGTVSVSWHGDDGVPWTVLHSEHWASNAVLTVNGAETSIQSALIYLNGVLNRRPDYMQDLVDRSIVWAAVEQAGPEVDEATLDAAVAAFRRRQGLTTIDALCRWLDQMQLTEHSLRELVLQNEQIRAFKRMIVADRVEPCFAANAEAFARVSAFLVDASSPHAAERIAAAWHATGACPVLEPGSAFADAEAQLRTGFARDLDPAFAVAPVGAIVVPPGSAQVGQVLARHAAVLDDATQAAIEALLFAEWLDERRQAASIRWHWI